MARHANTQVLDLLRKKILCGGYDKRSILPSERALASEYHAGRTIIRSALRILQEEKIIYKVPKRGWHIRSNPEEQRLKRIILHLPVQMSISAYECMGIVAGVCASANDIFAEVILSSPPMRLDVSELEERFHAGDIQGIILLEETPDLMRETLENMSVPCVVANLEKELSLPCVRMDYREAGRKAGQELIRHGYRRKIAVFSGAPELFIYRELLAGFRGALAEENICLDESLIFYGTKESVPEALKELFSRPKKDLPEVFFTLRDYRAEMLYQLCAGHSLAIPRDMGVISYDCITWPGAEKAGLYSIKEDVHEIGRQSVMLLQKLCNEPDRSSVESCLIQGKLVSGKSLK